ncbi:MAG: hypothetical protein HPY50_05280 [Firmicutes bacterium]|nr:hypothetical protein [Bacillota bacterium]
MDTADEDQKKTDRDQGPGGTAVMEPRDLPQCSHSRPRPIWGLKIAACESCGRVVFIDNRDTSRPKANT